MRGAGCWARQAGRVHPPASSATLRRYIPTLVIERPLYYRERSDGVYTAGLYLLNKVVEESILSVVSRPVCDEPWCAAFTLPCTAEPWPFLAEPQVVACAATIVFSFSVGLQGHFVIVWMAYFLALSCSTTLAYFIAASTSTLEAANALFPTLITVDLFFAGFLIHQNSIPGFIRWISYLDFMRYAWRVRNVRGNLSRPNPAMPDPRAGFRTLAARMTRT